jgi:hypothetical protein
MGNQQIREGTVLLAKVGSPLPGRPSDLWSAEALRALKVSAEKQIAGGESILLRLWTNKEGTELWAAVKLTAEVMPKFQHPRISAEAVSIEENL